MERINETLGELGAVELVGLDQFICGLNTEETGQLNTDAFRSDMDSACVCVRVSLFLNVLYISIGRQYSRWARCSAPWQ